MKIASGIFGLLLILGGAVWFLQGIGILPGSFMSGESFWAVAGFLAVIAGVWLVRNWVRKEPSPPESDSEDNPEEQ